MKKLYHLIICLILLTCEVPAFAQTYTVGTNDGQNTNISYPTPFGDFYKTQRVQYLYKASEMTAAGMTAGTITNIRWNVVSLPAGTDVTEGYTIKMLATSITTLDITSFEAGASIVWGPNNYTPVAGINNFLLTSGFFWDGVSNVVVEICGGDPGGTYTHNALVPWSGPLAFNGSHTFRSDTYSGVCDYSGNENFDYTPGGQDYRPQILFTEIAAANCNVLGTAGPISTTLGTVCDGQEFTLSIPVIAAVGITYQWSKSPDGTSWSNIAGATLPTLTTSQTTAYYYRCKVTCTLSGDVEFAPSIHILQNPITSCYCQPVYTTGTTEGDYVGNVHLGAINNTTGAAPAPFYTYYSALTTNLNPGAPYSMTITVGSYITNNGVAAWIDYNQDGVFNDVTEKLGEVIGLPAFSTTTISFTVPVAALTGTTRLRVRDVWNTAGIAACDTYGYGETEDYNVNFVPGVPPVADYTFTGDPTVSFTDISTGSPTSWSWTFGDGGTSTTENPVHTYTTNGTYNACLTATNYFGSDGQCHSVVIDSYLAPVANFSFTGDPTVTFTDLSTNSPTSWSWNFGDGGTSTLENPVHTYATNGIYNVCLTATNVAGSDVQCYNVTIDSYLAPVANFSYSGDPVVTFNDLSTNAPTSWFWYFGDGATSTLQNPVHTYTTNGVYNVCLTATNATGSNTFCQNVTIDSYLSPLANFSYTGDPTVTFTDLSIHSPTSWSWDFGDGGTSTAENPVHNYATNGTYNVCLTATNLVGSNTYCQDVIIDSYIYAPVADFSYTGDPTVVFTDLSINSPTSWSWTFGDGGTATAENPTHTYAINGTYSVCLTATNIAGSDNVCHTLNITGHPAPVASFIYSGDPVVDFTDLTTNSPTSWYWDFDDGGISTVENPTHIFAVNGTYNVCLTATAPGGTDTYCQDVPIANNGAVPVADFTYIATGLTVSFTDLSTNIPNDWLWEFGDGSISGLQNPTHAYAVTGNYTVCLTATNDFGFDNTCHTVVASQLGIHDAVPVQIHVSPNPATDFTVIYSTQPQFGESRIELKDMQGRSLITSSQITKMPDGSFLINLIELPAGTYILKVVSGSIIYSGQLIKL